MRMTTFHEIKACVSLLIPNKIRKIISISPQFFLGKRFSYVVKYFKEICVKSTNTLLRMVDAKQG